MILAGMVVMGLSVVSVAMAQAPSAGPQVGDPAPAFSLPGSDGATHSLAEFKGKRAVVVAWYPKAFTGG
jgi:peroxiredoxin Q/BCP